MTTAMNLRVNGLDRQQAMTLLRELVVNDLVDPVFIHINERFPNNYQLQIKTKYNRQQLDDFARNKPIWR
jgi:hypothetical protein